MSRYATLEPQGVLPIDDVPYDRWIDPDGGESARFYRVDGGFLVRILECADFFIDAQTYDVRCTPHEGTGAETVSSLYHNSILPIIGNHNGETNLHGSAVSNGEEAIAFMGVSRRGKTTLAGAFAKAGYPFLTEDVLALKDDGSRYMVLPSRPVLRLFGDSASYLYGAGHDDEDDEKGAVEASEAIPHDNKSVPLRSIFFLESDDVERIVIERLDAGNALSGLIQQSFILDVEDRKRLRAHFERIGAVADRVPCYRLDYPREYGQLPQVLDAIVKETGWNNVGS